VASSIVFTISNAVFSFINKQLQCQLLTTFFAGHHMFTSIQNISYFSFSIILAAFANISGSFQNICIISGFSELV